MSGETLAETLRRRRAKRLRSSTFAGGLSRRRAQRHERRREADYEELVRLAGAPLRKLAPGELEALIARRSPEGLADFEYVSANGHLVVESPRAARQAIDALRAARPLSRRFAAVDQSSAAPTPRWRHNGGTSSRGVGSRAGGSPRVHDGRKGEMVRRVMIAALLVGAVFAVQGATSLAAGSGGAKLAITQTVSGGTDTISLTGTGWPANSTVDWTVAACTRVMGKCTTFSNVVLGSSLTDASGSFNAGTVDSVPCGSNRDVFAEAVNTQVPKRVDTIKKLAC